MMILIALCGLALMLAASRCGTAAIGLGIVVIALLGLERSMLYVVAPAAIAFVIWFTWFYARERRKVRYEESIGRAARALAAIKNAAGGQSRNHAGGAPTPGAGSETGWSGRNG